MACYVDHRPVVLIFVAFHAGEGQIVIDHLKIERVFPAPVESDELATARLIFDHQ